MDANANPSAEQLSERPAEAQRDPFLAALGERVRSLRARKGRASYLGHRSVGYQDPGAVSTELLFRALAEVMSSVRVCA